MDAALVSHPNETDQSLMISRLRKTSSLAFTIALWVFAATMFADAANVDDLLSGRVVFHDDESDASVPFMVASAGTSATGHADHGPFSLKKTGEGKQLTLRIVYDQDSPSLPADHIIARDLCFYLPFDAPLLHAGAILSHEAIHIRLCTLLL